MDCPAIMLSMVKGRTRGPLGGKPRGTRRVWRRIYLKEWREYRGLSQEALAAKAGVSTALISEIEAGNSGGSPESLEKLAKALQCEVGELLDIKPESGGRIMRMWVSDDVRPQIEAVAKALGAVKS